MGQRLEGQSGPVKRQILGPNEINRAKKTNNITDIGIKTVNPLYPLCGGVVLGCLVFALLPLPIMLILGLSVLAVLGLSLIFITGRWIAIGLLLACCAGSLQVWRLDGPTLQDFGQRTGLGTLKRIEPTARTQRLFMQMDLLEGQVPLRLTYSGDAELHIGGRYQVVFWTPPPRSLIYPGAYNGAYDLWGQGIRGVGAAQKLVPISPPASLIGVGCAGPLMPVCDRFYLAPRGQLPAP